MPRRTTHSTGRAISKPLIENLSVAAVRARRLIRALGRFAGCASRIMRRISPHFFLAMMALASFASPSVPSVAHASVPRAPGRISFRGHHVVAFTPAGKRIWRWSSANPVTDAMIGWRGHVYVTALDGNIVALGPGGRQVWSHFLNGSGQYVQIERYGTDGFAAKIDASAYRERHNDPGLPDVVQIFRRNGFVRSVEFPANARLVVSGSNLYAVYRRRGRLHRAQVL